MAVDFGGVKMKNPINTASGTFGYGWQFSELMDVSQLGAITTKGCAAEAWPGNPAPRMAEVPGGMMNSVGLQNPGVAAFAEQSGPWLADLTAKGTQVICQVAGHSTEEYVRALEMFVELCPWAAGYEINVSCPNIAAGGAACGSTPEGASEVMRACRKVTDKPLFVKMAPVRIPEIARALEAEGADGLTVINSIREVVSMPVQGITNGCQPVLGYNYGAGEYERVRRGIRFTTVLTVGYSVAAWALVMAVPELLIRIFNDEPELIAAGIPAFRLYFAAFFCMSFQFIGQSVFVGLGRSRSAVFFSLLRKAFIVAPLTLLLPGLGMGVDGVFAAEPVSNVLGGLACLLTMYITVYRRLGR